MQHVGKTYPVPPRRFPPSRTGGAVYFSERHTAACCLQTPSRALEWPTAEMTHTHFVPRFPMPHWPLVAVHYYGQFRGIKTNQDPQAKTPMCVAAAETFLLFVDSVLLVELQSGDVTPGQRSAFFGQVFKRLFTWRDYVKWQLSQLNFWPGSATTSVRGTRFSIKIK